MLSKSKRDAFTLIELLTVIAIIAVLAGILIPTIGKVRDNALSAECVSNLRALHTGFQFYAMDNRGRLPTSGLGDEVVSPAGKRWSTKVATYMPEVEDWRERGGVSYLYNQTYLRCPITPAGNGATGVYGYNENLATEDDQDGASMTYLNSLDNPTKLPLLSCANASAGLLMRTSGPHPSAKEYGYSGPTTNSGPSPNHGPLCNFLFADGHVESRDITSANAWPWNEPDIFLPKAGN
ncbi:type II secretion system protein [Coraliomargarita sp. W4R53]